MFTAQGERCVGAVGLLGCAALFGSLFLTWYHVFYTSMSHAGGGFFLRFGGGTSDAWNAVSDTSLVLAGCAIVCGALLVTRLIGGSRLPVLAAVALALVALGLTAYRIANAPSYPRGVQPSYFDRANGVPASSGVRSGSGVTPTSAARDGAVVALCAAAVAALASCALLTDSRPVQPASSR